MIYIVCSCDIWKTTDSMRIITATTSVTKLKQLYGLMEAIDEDVDKAARCLLSSFDFYTEVEAAIKRNYVPPTE